MIKTAQTRLNASLVHMLTATCSATAFLLLAGCATTQKTQNGFSQFYRDHVGTNTSNLQPYSGSTRIITTSDPAADGANLMRSGYVCIGQAAFQGLAHTEDSIKAQGQKVGADVVMYRSGYLGSQQASMPWIQYNPGQTYTTYSSGAVSANAYGSGGYAYGTGNYYGSSTTTTPGTFNTQFVPVTIHRYQYEAAFWRLAKPGRLGLRMGPLPPEMRVQLERNTGVQVLTVINDSPAFRANILEGDVILKLNTFDVGSVADGQEILRALAGQKVTVQILRHGQMKEIAVQLNP